MPLVFHDNIRVLPKVDWHSTTLLSRRLSIHLGSHPYNQFVCLRMKPYISKNCKLSRFIVLPNMGNNDCIVGYQFLSLFQISVNYYKGCYVTKSNGIRTESYYIGKSDTRIKPWTKKVVPDPRYWAAFTLAGAILQEFSLQICSVTVVIIMVWLY